MTIPVRRAHPGEFPVLRSLIAAAFKDGEESLWDYLAENDPSITPEAVHVALSPAGEPVACTVALARSLMGPGGPVRGSVITLVACRSDMQGQGYGGATVRDALRAAAGRGEAFAMLIGHPDYYPRFGFVPVAHEVRTLLPAAEALAEQAGQLRPAVAADLPVLSDLYDRHLAHYPCAVARGPAPWVWRVRAGRPFELLLLDGAGPAYALVAANREQDLLFVSEAAADGPAAALRLLAGLAREARRRGLQEVRLAMPPDHLVSRVAVVLLQAEQVRRPARHLMVAVTDWAPLLPPGFTVGPDGLSMNGRLVLTAPQPRLVQLAFGARTVDDLLLEDAGWFHGDEGDLAAIRGAFPARHAKWSLAPFWL